MDARETTSTKTKRIYNLLVELWWLLEKVGISSLPRRKLVSMKNNFSTLKRMQAQAFQKQTFPRKH